MTTNNKILTVSYGTFSCSLEGFDDNFGTMKAIADYFRDLASDDRYFGAEPPQPDVEMLARIAEREISRRVKARQQDGRLVLNAEQDPETVEPVSHTPEASDTKPYLEPTGQDVGVTIDHLADQTDAAQPNAPKSIETADTHVGSAETETSTSDAQSEKTPTPSEDIQHEGEAAEASGFDAEQFFAQPSAEVQIMPSDSVAQAEAFDMPEAPAPNSIAAKLQRIRAVVTQNQDKAEETNIFEDEYAEDFAAESAPDSYVIESVAADVAQATFEGDKSVLEQAVHAVEALQAAESAAIEKYESDVENDDIVTALAQLASNEHSTSDDPVTQTEVAFAQDAPETEALLRGQPVRSLAETSQAPEQEKSGLLLSDHPPSDASPEYFMETGHAGATDAADKAKPRFPRARIIKVKRADIDAAIARGALEEIEDTGPDAFDSSQADAAIPDTETSEKERETSAIDKATTNTDTDRQSGVDDDVSRLMAEADSKMEEPEGTSRRSAFAHLKAAVMAKKTDLAMGEDATDKDVAYRSDLASVVKPRRPEKDAGAPHADSKRPAPLTLIAEQRIDIGPVPTGPVRPRRVAAREEPTGPETGTSFEEYASERGANDLPELLEAAASYLSFVEGREQFSRPQLMTKVRQIEKDDFSREDGLRSFGKLLRTGKIEKIKGGRFAVTDDIGYQPDQRAAG